MQNLTIWFRPGLNVKRWLVLSIVGVAVVGVGISQLLHICDDLLACPSIVNTMSLHFLPTWLQGLILVTIGLVLFVWGFSSLHKSLIKPLIAPRSLSEWVTIVQTQQQLKQGIKVVAIGGGTGLPSALRAMKPATSNITAIVTMADDGGSSGRLRRDLGVPPPGDLRSNITALAHDEDLMTRLFDFRFNTGELNGHSLGNLFLAALADITGGMEEAAAVAGHVLAIQGQVIPCTLNDVRLAGELRHSETGQRIKIKGESNIPQAGWIIEKVQLDPENVMPTPAALKALHHADLIIIGPGSLYTSILPNLLVNGIADAIKASKALRVYICNIATQEGETGNYDVADHVIALENHVREDFFDVVLANNHYPSRNAGPNTIYVQHTPPHHPVLQKYHVVYADLTDDERPWRHSHEKLHREIMKLQTDNIQRKSQLRSSRKAIVLR